MIKIAICVRNRLAVTKKCIEALYEHTTTDFHLYIYDNLTNYNQQKHFEYFWNLYANRMVTQVTFNTKESTFNAFSKAVALNQFGRLHEEDPQKNQYEFLLFLDNDMLVMPGWDEIISQAWKEIKEKGMSNVKVIGRHPHGGVKFIDHLKEKIAGYDVGVGQLGGSGFWAVKPDFYRDIGYLEIKPLVGLNKKHDQNYWKLLNKHGKKYIMVLKHAKLVVDSGSYAGSICNVIGYGKDKNKMQKIKYEDRDKQIDKMSFTEFYKRMKKLTGM